MGYKHIIHIGRRMSIDIDPFIDRPYDYVSIESIEGYKQ